MTLRKFNNALRILSSLDLADLVEADVLPKYADGNFNSMGVVGMFTEFRRNPTEWFLRATDHQQELLWALIESRQPDNLKGEQNVP